MLNDMWMLRLSNFSTELSRYRQTKYLEANCNWRESAASYTAGSHSCMDSDGSPCEFRDLIMLAWCTDFNYA
jgi:hypothetical protein